MIPEKVASVIEPILYKVSQEQRKTHVTSSDAYEKEMKVTISDKVEEQLLPPVSLKLSKGGTHLIAHTRLLLPIFFQNSLFSAQRISSC